MTQEDKELLILKDLCARLPYGVICKDDYAKVEGKLIQIGINYDMCLLSDDYGKTEWAYIPNCKPYLFPLSSMTEEQKKEYEDALVYHDYVEGGWTIAKLPNDEYFIPSWFVDFCNKNHFDIYGLIPMGLAIDATGLDIY